MSAIHVCSAARLAERLQASRASHVVSLCAEAPSGPLAGLPPERRLWLAVSDIAAPQAGHVLPASPHVARLVDFVLTWDRAEPLLIHCYAGVSRSTAAAFIALCVLQPDIPETVLAAKLRAASPTATPNRRLVALADGLLGREGRMGAAIRAIGRGAECFEGNCFVLPIRGAARPPGQGCRRRAVQKT